MLQTFKIYASINKLINKGVLLVKFWAWNKQTLLKNMSDYLSLIALAKEPIDLKLKRDGSLFISLVENS